MILFLSLISCVDYELNRRKMSDSYVQPSRESGVDILWVIDNSASMFEEQEQLANHVSHFTDYITAAPVDFRIGVITTDMSGEEPGRFIEQQQLHPGTLELADAFADLIVLEEGSRDEKGFETTLLALEPEGINQDFIDPAADLEVIFFSDEDEQSEMSAESFVSSLNSLRSNSNIAVNAITGDPPEGCASVFGAADPGFKYHEVQENTLGLRESICSLDYNAMLERIALKVLGLENTFALNAAPDLDTMEVLVDGALVHRRERHGWQYDAGQNAIVFDGFAVPPPGAEIVFKYFLWIGTEDDLEEEVEGEQ